MKKKPVIVTLSILILISAIWYATSAGGDETLQLTAIVKRGEFKSIVNSSGELLAKNSTRIKGPREARMYRINEMKVADLIPEGSVIKKGDYVGRLDLSQISNSEKDLLNELDKTESQYTQVKLDTALDLRAKRDEIKNLRFSVEERKIEVKYSEFEPPAIQRTAQINLEKAERAYKNAQESYGLKRRQSVAKVREVGAALAIQQNSLAKLRSLIEEFTIYAPQDGMMIYAKEWSGKKIMVGSSISSWDPTIAELPDMSVMISKTMVNEVDISKVKVGQEVEVGIDAFPDKSFPGKVTYVANIGENNSSSSGKSFEVTVELTKADSIVRPGMTTSNGILTFKEDDVLSVPLECIYTQDSLTYVLKSEGLSLVKQEVKVGKSNEVETIILAGLKEGDEVYLMLPDGIEGKEIQRLKD